MSYYHLRFSVIDKDKALPVVSRFKETFPISSLAVGYETVDDNLHIHCHVVYKEGFNPDENKVKTKRCALTKKLKKELLIPDIPNATYHEIGKATDLSNLAYCLKGRDILLLENIEEATIKEALAISDRIEREKKTPMKDQLLQEWKRRGRLFVDKMEAYMFIDYYHVERNYLPPNMTLKLQYSLYILCKLGHMGAGMLSYYQLYSSFYNIKEEYVHNMMTIHELVQNNDVLSDLDPIDISLDQNEVNFQD